MRVFTVGLVFLGIKTTVTVQVPLRIPRTVLPTKVQYFVPRVMEMRMVPCERFGIFNETAAAIFAAVSDRSRFTFNTLVALALVRPVSTPIGLDVDVTGVVVVVVAASVVVAATVVVAARVVVAAIVVVASTVVVATVVVVVGNALKNGTATATLLLSCELSPSWPKSFRPQHNTSPAGVITHACDAPAEIVTAPLESPCTDAGTASSDTAFPRPNCPAALLPKHCTAPVFNMMQVNASPADTRDAVPLIVTAVGVENAVVLFG